MKLCRDPGCTDQFKHLSQRAKHERRVHTKTTKKYKCFSPNCKGFHMNIKAQLECRRRNRSQLMDYNKIDSLFPDILDDAVAALLVQKLVEFCVLRRIKADSDIAFTVPSMFGKVSLSVSDSKRLNGKYYRRAVAVGLV